MAFSSVAALIIIIIIMTSSHTSAQIYNSTTRPTTTPCPTIHGTPISSCPRGFFRDNCGGCDFCKTLGDTCQMTAQCCGGEAILCRNFSAKLAPQCLCPQDFQWDADGMRCYLPVSLPQQLILIAVYCALAVLILIGVIATLLHMLRSKLGICVRRKEHHTLEMDLEDQEISAVLDQPRPPPYSAQPPDNAGTNSVTATASATVQAGIRMSLPVACTLQAINPNEPPPAYVEEDSFSDSRLLQSNLQSYVAADVHHEEDRVMPLPDIVVTPPSEVGDMEMSDIVITPNNLAPPPPPHRGLENEAFLHDNACCSSSPDDESTSQADVKQEDCSKETEMCKTKKLEDEDSGESSKATTLPPRVKFDFSKYLSFQQSRSGGSNSEHGTFTSPACDMA